MTNLSAICMGIGLSLAGATFNLVVVLIVIALVGLVTWFMNKKF